MGDLTLATKWDRGQLKKQVGSVLNDVQTVSDTAFAELVLGLTLEEILEPLDRIQNPGEAHVDTMLVAKSSLSLSCPLLSITWLAS